MRLQTPVQHGGGASEAAPSGDARLNRTSTGDARAVRFRLKPREDSFYSLFAEAGENLVRGASLLCELVDGSPESRQETARQLIDAEHRGDDLTHTILRQVNATFVTPFDREDIFRLASRVDDVMDYMEAAGDLIVLYNLLDLPKEFSTMAGTLCQAAAAASGALKGLQDPTRLQDYFVEANRLENEGDRLYRNFLATLFGGSYETLAVLKLKDVAEQLESAADAFEHVADMVETIAVKES
jgi:hypothetical protein